MKIPFNKPQPKVFTNCGMSITLNEDFVIEDESDVNVEYASNEIFIGIARAPLGNFADCSAAEFCDKRIETNRFDTVTQQKDE